MATLAAIDHGTPQPHARKTWASPKPRHPTFPEALTRHFDEQVSCRHTEPIRQIEKPLVKKPPLALLDVYEHIARYSRHQRELFLGEALLLAD